MQVTNAQDVVQEYLEAFSERALARCVDMYSDDALVFFPPVTYEGKQAVKDWHEARFLADARLVRMDNMTVNGDTVVIQGSITSKKLKVWRIPSVSGRAIFQVREGKIASLRFDLKAWNSFLGRSTSTEAFRTKRTQDT